MSQPQLSRNQRKRQNRKKHNKENAHNKQFGHFVIIKSPIIIDSHKSRLNNEIDTEENDEGVNDEGTNNEDNISPCSICGRYLTDHHARSCSQRCPCQLLHNKHKHTCAVCLKMGIYHDPQQCARNKGQILKYSH